jgi:hypothetical protein
MHYYSAALQTFGYVQMFNAANTSIPTLTETVNKWSVMPAKGIWFTKDAITSITVANVTGSGTITGTLELYGLV